MKQMTEAQLEALIRKAHHLGESQAVNSALDPYFVQNKAGWDKQREANIQKLINSL